MTVVDFFVKNTAPSPAAVPGVVVSLLDVTTSVVVSQTTTDSAGLAGFTVPDATYEVRMFKSGFRSIVSQVEVISSEDNTFDLTVEDLTSLPSAVDSMLCRCTGKFVDFSNRPRAGVTFRVHAQPEAGFEIPKIAGGSMVFEQTMEFKTDDNGLISIDLFRGGQFNVVFAGEDDVIWNIQVPNVASANLIDLIHPYPTNLDWNHTDAPSDAVTVSVNQTVTIRSTLTFSDYEQKTEGQDQWISFTNSDGNKMDLGFNSAQGLVVIRGMAAGTAQVTATILAGKLPSRFPFPTLLMNPLHVTVVP